MGSEMCIRDRIYAQRMASVCACRQCAALYLHCRLCAADGLLKICGMYSDISRTAAEAVPEGNRKKRDTRCIGKVRNAKRINYIYRMYHTRNV